MITLSMVKTFLGIVGDDHDDMITALIPVVEADVRRIMNHDYNRVVKAVITDGSDYIDIKRDSIAVGTIVESPALPAGTYVVSGFFGNLLKLSANATADGSEVVATIDMGQAFTMAKMVWFKTTKANTSKDFGKVASKSMGPVSVTFSENLDKKTGYPEDLVKDLGIPYARIC